jgi:exonuclease SbcC
MRINRLRLCNFRQHEDTELVLGAGLTGIIGPNGAGKTTLLEAIAWAMYGMKAARGSRDTIRRRGAPPRCRVEVEMEFTLGAHVYRVVRGLSNAELYQDGGATPIANSLEAVTERITRLLGMTRDEFFNTYFTGQKELAVMASMSAPERAQFLSRVLGYEKIRAAQERLKDRRTSMRARLSALQSSLPDAEALRLEDTRTRERERVASLAVAAAEDLMRAADAAYAELRPRWEAMQLERERAAALDADLRVAESQVSAARDRAGDLERQAAAAAAARAELATLEQRLGPLAALRDECAALDKASAAHTAHRGAVAQLEEVRGRLAELDARLAGLPEPAAVAAAKARTNDVRARLAAAALRGDELRTSWVRDRQDAANQHQHLRDQYQELKDQRQRIVDAGVEGACPTCARPLGREFENVLGVLDRQIDAVLGNGKYYRQRVAQLEGEPPELDAAEGERVRVEQELNDAVSAQARLEAQAAERASLVAARPALARREGDIAALAGAEAAAYDATRHEVVRREMGALEPVSLRAERLRDAAARADELAETATGAAQSLAETTARLEAIRAERARIAVSDEAYQAMRAEEQQADRARRGAEVGLVRARSELGAAVEAVAGFARRAEEIAARRREAEELSRDVALHQELDRALTDLRTDLNQTLRPELSEIASAFVRDLTNGRYTELELDEDYMATLLDDGDPKAVISGGEEDIANLALRLAISQMIAERAGQPLSLLVLDEIFGSLDEERRAAVVELLRGLADRFPQVILITHIDTVRDGFDRIIRVGFDPARGSAVVRDEPPGGHDLAA